MSSQMSGAKKRIYMDHSAACPIDERVLQAMMPFFADSFGNKTRLQFRNIKSNNGLAEKLFTFSPPAGVEIYNNP